MNIKHPQKSRLQTVIALLALLFVLGGGWVAVDQLAALSASTCDLMVGPGEGHATIQSAVNSATSGQTICVRGGVYHEAVDISSQKTGLTLIAMPGETPILDGQKRLPGGAVGDRFRALLEVKGAGTTIDGFEIRFSSARGLDVSADNVTVRNTRVHDNWSTGINVNASSPPSNVLIENNVVYMNMRRSQHAPVVYKGERAGDEPNGWTFDPDVQWDAPFWSGAQADLPEQWLNSLSMTFNDDGHTNRVYVGSGRAGRAGQIGAAYSASGQLFSYSGADILFHEPSTNKWTLYFDGEPLGITAADEEVIDAFQIESTETISEPWPCPLCAPMLLSFTATVTIPIDEGVITPTVTPTAVGPSDLVYFRPTAMNGSRIAGGFFTLYKTAADLFGLPQEANIDALDRAPDGRLLISLADTHTLTNPDNSTVIAEREDLVSYDETTGYWSLFFEGDQIPYNPFQAEDLTAAWVDDDGDIYISGDPIGGSALTLIGAINGTLRGNQVFNNFGEGLVADRGSVNSFVENNILYDNQHANLYLNSTIDTTVRGNFVYCTDDRTFWHKGSSAAYSPSPGIQIRDELWLDRNVPLSSGYQIINNVVYGCATNFGVSTQRPGGGLNNSLVANNTFAHARGDSPVGNDNVSFAFSSGISVNGSSFINNLLLQSPMLAERNIRFQGQGDLSGFTVAHNLYSPTLIGLPSQWPQNEPGQIVTADPRLANAALGEQNPPLPERNSPPPNPADFRLRFDSPAFAAGQHLAGVTHDFGGRLRDTVGFPDIGAHELPHQGIIVTNALIPDGDTQLIDFTLLPGDSFPLGHGGARVFVFPPGVSKSLASSVPEGWRQTAASCGGENTLEAIMVSESDWVTCAFTHERLGGIIVRKETLPPGQTQSFAFTMNGTDSFSLAHGETYTAAGLASGPYGVAETLPPNWAQVSASCDDGSSPAAIDLGAGETVTCTFTNARLALDLTLTPSPGMVTAPGGNVTFTLQVANDSGMGVELNGLVDSIYGDVADAGNPALENTGCQLPQSMAAGAVYECSFVARVAGTGGTLQSNTLTATAVGPGNTSVSAAVEAAVAIDSPPPGRIIVTKRTDPPDTPGVFQFTTSYGNFSLSHGQSHDSGPLASGVSYSVAETASPGWAISTATCEGDDDGSNPAAIMLDPGETVTCTFVNRRTTTGPLATFYVTTPLAGKVRGLAYSPGDILAYDNATDTWSIYFDASDVGIAKALNDFVLMDDGSILMAFKVRLKPLDANGKILTIEPHDIARFVPQRIGNDTAGWFEHYFDGSDVGLSTTSEKIDALALGPDGALLISTTGAAAVKRGSVTLKAQDEDLLAFAGDSLGSTTTGTWSLAFDGSTLAGMAVENLTAAWRDPANGHLFLTVTNNFTIKGIKGTNRTVLSVSPAGVVESYWDASTAGLAVLVDGLHISRR